MQTTKRLMISDFDFWYEGYPKKRGKADARKAWLKLKPDADLVARMVAAIEKQKQADDWLKEGGKYIPLPATWLRGERWEDEIPTPSLAHAKRSEPQAGDPYITQMLGRT